MQSTFEAGADQQLLKGLFAGETEPIRRACLVLDEEFDTEGRDRLWVANIFAGERGGRDCRHDLGTSPYSQPEKRKATRTAAHRSRRGR